MATYAYTGLTAYNISTGNHSGINPGAGVMDDGDAGDNFFSVPENVHLTFTYAGTVTVSGTTYPVLTDGTFYYVMNASLPVGTYPSFTDLGPLDSSAFPTCYAAGSLIATQSQEKAVETLRIGDVICNADRKAVLVKWVGRQTVFPTFSGPGTQPVRIRAGALGDGLPHSDLTVTADHGMVLDGLVVNASALVNGHSIDWVPMAELPDSVTWYHIETEAHDVILANGAPSETFVDAVGRAAFDNHAEYLGLYGAERIIPEMDRPRITSARLLPDALAQRLGIAKEVPAFESHRVA